MQALLEVVVSNAAAGTLLALLAAGLSALCRRPALTHRLWLLVLLKLVTPPLVLIHLPWAVSQEPAGAVPAPRAVVDAAPALDEAFPPAAAPAVGADEVPADPPGAAPLTERSAAPEVAQAALSWAGCLVPLWLLTALLWTAWNGLHLFRFRRCLRYAVPAPAYLQEQARALAEQLGLRRCPPVLLVPGAVPPMVWGLGGRPRLLFPAGLLGRLDEGQRASLLLHELAHVRRGDPWVRLLELVVVPLYWWHPVVWWARRELHEAEEQCCDAWVVWALAGSGRTYAVALLQALAFCARAPSPLPAAASGLGPIPHLRRRLTMIVQAKTPRALSWGGAVAVLGLGLLLPLLPVRGQPPATPAAAEPAADKDSTDQKLEDLKKAIRALEEQRVADKLQGVLRRRIDVIRVETKDAAGVEHAAVEVQQATADVEQKRAELAQAEARLALAKARLDRQKKALEAAPEAGKATQSIQVSPYTTPYTVRVVPQAGGQVRGDRLADLEQKLEQVLREVEGLRKELHRERQPGQPVLPPPVKPPAPPVPEAVPNPPPSVP